VNVGRAVQTGISGVSVEDSTGDPDDPLYEFNLAVERAAAAREAIDASGTGGRLTARSEGLVVGLPDIGETVRPRGAFSGAGRDPRQRRRRPAHRPLRGVRRGPARHRRDHSPARGRQRGGSRLPVCTTNREGARLRRGRGGRAQTGQPPHQRSLHDGRRGGVAGRPTHQRRRDSGQDGMERAPGGRQGDLRERHVHQLPGPPRRRRPLRVLTPDYLRSPGERTEVTHGKAILDELKEPMVDLRRRIPEVFEGYAALSKAVYGDGALDAKTKELIALAISVSKQ